MAFLWQVRLLFMEHIRQPGYMVSTVAFPALFYLIFAVPESQTRDGANLLMASFSAFAVFGVLFLQFGVGLAGERYSPWYVYLRTLPLPAWRFFAARILTAMALAALAAGMIVTLALLATPAEMGAGQWLRFVFWLSFGSVPLAFMGMAMGYWVSEKAALPLGNLVYLPVSFASGLWKPPQILPQAVQDVSPYLPARPYGELLWSVTRQEAVRAQDWQGLLLWALLFLGLALWGYRRNRSRQFS